MSTHQQLVDVLAAKPGDFVEAVEMVRAGMVESRHRAIAALTGPDGKLIDHIGSTKRLIFARSALKPLQAVAMRRAGLSLAGAQLAISVASHQGTPEHIALVRAVLEQAGLDESALQCPMAWPGNPAARAQVAAAGLGESRLAFNCSGKHAGFLAAANAAGWSTSDYLDLEHPLQQLVVEVLEQFTGERIVLSTIDGCGAPLHATTVEGLARAGGRLVLEQPEIAAAMRSNAWVVGDQNTPDAVLMRGAGATSGDASLMAKLGAEGVMLVGTADGHGVAVKIADGGLRAAALVAIGLLRRNDLLAADAYDSLWNELAPKVLGGDQVVGEFRLV